MPTYQYACDFCGHHFEQFVSITAFSRKMSCPVCNKAASVKISGGAGIIFRGDGFYETDYKRKSNKESTD